MTDQTADAPAPLEAAPAETAPRAKARHPWTDTSAHPWRRFFARTLDLSLFGTVSAMIIAFAWAVAVSPEQAETAFSGLDGWVGRLLGGMVLIILGAPLMALSIAWTGGTPGKWLMGVRVQRPDGRRLSLGAAFRREVVVGCIGMGLGVPLLSLFFMHNGKEALEAHDETSWDEDRNVVVHRDDGALQTALFVIGVAIWACLRLWDIVDRVASMGL
jgi:uncharacterized RDD family membrane protein YckC